MNTENKYYEMIEGLVDKSQQSIYDTGIIGIPLAINAKYYRLTINDESCSDKVEITLDGYDIIQEGGKWFAVKKKKEYPKTYEECRKIMDIDTGFLLTSYDLDFWKGHLLTSLQKLLICRNAYWKIAGEEMGLGKPWEPDWTNLECDKFCIWVDVGDITLRDVVRCQHILAFPTPEMRDAFFENFKELIEQCKELL